MFKQHMEILKLREEIQNAAAEKQQLEDEIKSRNQEVYQMNEKLIFLEFNNCKKPEAKEEVSKDFDFKLVSAKYQGMKE